MRRTVKMCAMWWRIDTNAQNFWRRFISKDTHYSERKNTRRKFRSVTKCRHWKTFSLAKCQNHQFDNTFTSIINITHHNQDQVLEIIDFILRFNEKHAQISLSRCCFFLSFSVLCFYPRHKLLIDFFHLSLVLFWFYFNFSFINN